MPAPKPRRSPKPPPAPAKRKRTPSPKPSPPPSSAPVVPLAAEPRPAPVAPHPLTAPSEPRPPAPASDETFQYVDQRRRLTIFSVLLAALILAYGVLLYIGLRFQPQNLFWDTAYFLIPTLTAALIVGGLQRKLPTWLRLGLPSALFLLLLFGFLSGDPLAALIETLFLVFLPIWGAIAVAGGGRHRWTAAQILGMALLLFPLWRSLYFTIYDIHDVFTPGDVQETIPRSDLYLTFYLKILRETFFVVLGLLLFFRRMPFVQKPPGRGDVPYALKRIDSWIRRSAANDLAWGPFFLTLAIVANVVIFALLENFRSLDTGDDSQVFLAITIDLVFLISLAAGVGEELVFRGLLQPYFTRLYGGTTTAFVGAVFTQAFLFGIVHSGYGNLFHVIGPFGFGLLMGIAFRYFGILCAIYAHVAIDVIAFGFDAGKNYPWFNAFIGFFFLINAVFGVIWALYNLITWIVRRRRKPAPFLVLPDETPMPEHQTF